MNMASQMPLGLRQFRVSIISLPVYITAMCLIAISVGIYLLSIHDGHADWPDIWQTIKLMKREIVGACIFTPLLSYLSVIPGGFSSSGIYASSARGARRFIRWEDIAKVRKLTLLNPKFL
jgi:hypothetical protein